MLYFSIILEPELEEEVYQGQRKAEDMLSLC